MALTSIQGKLTIKIVIILLSIHLNIHFCAQRKVSLHFIRVDQFMQLNS